jgi:hypothetical protein
LSFVDGGLHWLDWAISHQSAAYDFADETALVGAVQQGLHASPYALLPGVRLMVSPIKLMTLGLGDLRTLAQAEQQGGNEASNNALQDVLRKHRLLTQANLSMTIALLTGWGVAGSPVFQALGMPEHMALYGLQRLAAHADVAEQAIQKEAAVFAAAQARTPCEFVDYFRVYLTLAAQAHDSTSTHDTRVQLAEDAIHTLLPTLFNALNCPQVNHLPSPEQVGKIVREWVMQGQQMGFARLTQGVQQVISHGGYHGEKGHAAHRLVHHYLDAAQAFLASTRVRHGLMRQDGASCTYPLHSEHHLAELELSASSVISLSEFGPRPLTSTHDMPAQSEHHPEEEATS